MLLDTLFSFLCTLDTELSRKKVGQLDSPWLFTNSADSNVSTVTPVGVPFGNMCTSCQATVMPEQQ